MKDCLRVPFMNLKEQYRKIKPEIDDALRPVFDKTAFISGEYAKRFESEYAQDYGTRNCVSVANGTDAIYIALRTLGVGPGDEVITVANSWISTSETITQAGARPVFVDIDPEFYTIDVDKISEKITPKTKAVIPVHLYGQPVDIKPIVEICKMHRLYLIEDCAQAHFAEYSTNGWGSSPHVSSNGPSFVGTVGDIGTFSFYPGKNLGAYGDAGAVITADDELAANIRKFANHGSVEKHVHDFEGINSRMDGIQAAVLSVKLRHIEKWTRRRIEIAEAYTKALSDVDGIVCPAVRPGATHVFHLYVVRVQKRDQLIAYLKDNNIETGIHYPKALPYLDAYAYLNHKPDDFPVAYNYQNEILSLPMCPELSEEQLDHVVSHIKAFYAGSRG